MSAEQRELVREEERENNEELYEAVETVFDYTAEEERLTREEVYSFVHDKGNKDELWNTLNKLTSTSYLSSGLFREHGEAEFEYWKE